MWRDRTWIGTYVDLPAFRVERARRDGKQRFYSPHKDPTKFENDLDSEICGCLGEEGVGMYLNLPYERRVHADPGYDYIACDKTLIEARCRRKGDWRNTLCQTEHPKAEIRYVFCEEWSDLWPVRVWLLGWLWGDEIPERGYAKSGGNYKKPFQWSLPISRLRSPKLLPR